MTNKTVTEQHVVIWFRSDLRVVDNTALNHAIDSGLPIIALFIATPMQWHQHNMAAVQVDFIHRRLQVLKQQLAKRNIPLQVIEVNDFAESVHVIDQVCLDYNVVHVFANKQYPINEQQRDNSVGELIANKGIKFSIFDDNYILQPEAVLTRDGELFKVFTPFRNAWIKRFTLSPSYPVTKESDIVTSDAVIKLLSVSNPIKAFNYPIIDSVLWPVDEETIAQRLETFFETKAETYHQNRDFPAIDGTSCLSPYLAIGALSARQCLYQLLQHFPNALEINKDDGAFTWLNEIVWREFYGHLLHRYPELSQHQPFQKFTRFVQWKDDAVLLKAWQEGKTGFPIVDAAMRQLRSTGWMHNRLRMITASFLTKDLLCDWRVGEQWFMQHLIDGDFASNNGGWQWAASTGTDAQPYFRVFNPTLQGQRFDPKGDFIRTWVKELEHVPDKYIHTPHQWASAESLNYPLPIVDHKEARLIAIESFKQAKAYMDIHQ
ncbi:deoxyribodipyrimidine photo-lyase [Photobacterium angustum]|uniref:Deoxyribodipyrimidine photo-lyase n=1 Tax=Photobacterium angustum TaxID=661 RepID=A0A855SFV5_PHOAN|nr:deoxyribodipyrimidine photo-lyase [Photobacterium angustum]KJF83209.1 deoxyribodipyrimidine photolyase [Photobacterium damselae subsp. damselae]KJG29128.1 deoxyribodipyrimidine photolyase [Photobacterium angustum]KJG42946.1 deoxyribodipyrimidine photolyase [Photobacterium angustum]KJG47517.1 deoxyribodipyrimidine photolyase [Photobacterium angustum]KJG53676.1 deoxyribodipyrimidine photolyase [Photobacterium angustum]